MGVTRDRLDEIFKEQGLKVSSHIEALFAADGILKDPVELWSALTKEFLEKGLPLDFEAQLFKEIYEDWNEDENGAPPAWIPEAGEVETTNIFAMMKTKGFKSYRDLHKWSVEARGDFWQAAIERLGILFKKVPKRVASSIEDTVNPGWLEGAKLNIVDSAFQAPDDQTALVFGRSSGESEQLSYGELRILVNRISNGIRDQGFKEGDALAIVMPMNIEAVAIYLGIVQAGCVAVSIADSFSPKEIATRLRLSGAKAVFTQDFLRRGSKTFGLLDRVKEAGAKRTIVVRLEGGGEAPLSADDIYYDDFLSSKEGFQGPTREPYDTINILFSSGTTGDPKAIPWNQMTPIKCAVDAHYHMDVQSSDRVAWPTNLGWMMGPWLIYASLLNRATMAIYEGPPTVRGFGEFIAKEKVSVLGTIPSIVKAWRSTSCMEGLRFSEIKCFATTGECSNIDDSLFLMALGQWRPIIEYCGGTEIGGGYITGTTVQPASPSTFSTPALGLDFVVLDEEQRPTDMGEVFLVGPSIGLSERLLNKDHFEVYFDGTPLDEKGSPLRRHGDQLLRLKNGYYRALGRSDDTMNLGGIKVSSAEIERTLVVLDEVEESAAIARSPEGGGPSQLVIYVVTHGEVDLAELKTNMQKLIKEKLNPLFKIEEVVALESLPRTASNKVMRRKLR
jgi:acetyl-CoA synthetase